VVAKDELDTLLGHAQLGKRVPLLFLANKLDLPSALTAVELAQVRGRVWPHGCVRLWPLRNSCKPCCYTPCCRRVNTHQALRLEALRDRPWQIVPTNGLSGEGLDKAMDWLAEKLLRK
jgi:ADP-ribosylation factor-like protein 6